MRTHHSNEFDGMEYELQFSPDYGLMEERIGDRLVVAYLVHDQDCENPMTSNDAEGTLYTKPSRYGGGSITDYSGWGGYLGLTEDGEPDLELDAVAERVYQKLKAVLAGDEFKVWMVKITLEAEASHDEAAEAVYNEWADQWGWNSAWGWDEDDREMLDALPSVEAVTEQAWEELSSEGKLVSRPK